MLALEHEPINFEEEIVEPEGSYEYLVDVENNLLYGDSYLRVVRCLSSNPIVSEEWILLYNVLTTQCCSLNFHSWVSTNSTTTCNILFILFGVFSFQVS